MMTDNKILFAKVLFESSGLMGVPNALEACGNDFDLFVRRVAVAKLMASLLAAEQGLLTPEAADVVKSVISRKDVCEFFKISPQVLSQDVRWWRENDNSCLLLGVLRPAIMWECEDMADPDALITMWSLFGAENPFDSLHKPEGVV